jgi:hypothetical protein
MPNSVKCKVHIRREVKQGALINCAFHFINGQFEKYHSVQKLLDCLHVVSLVLGSGISYCK